VSGSVRPPDAVLAVLVAGAELALVVVPATWLAGGESDGPAAVVVGEVELGVVDDFDLCAWE
jgi:hypothetical protein